MRRRELLIVAWVVLMAASGANAHSQAAQSGQATQANTQPQNSSQSAAQNSSANSSTSQSTTKKVWTNEELSAEDPNSGISTVGKATNGGAKRAVAARPVSANGRAKWYQDQIIKLQAKIPVLDGQIADLQAALDGKATGDGKKSARPYGVKMDDWSRELAELQQKRADTLDQISALRDQARHNGVAPNAIP